MSRYLPKTAEGALAYLSSSLDIIDCPFGDCCCSMPFVSMLCNLLCLIVNFVHVLQIQALGLWQEGPEEQGVRQVADNEHDVVSPSDGRDGNRCNLADHAVPKSSAGIAQLRGPDKGAAVDLERSASDPIDGHERLVEIPI
ncbi:hypothetical protein KC364_g9 [Hortaea werneckii]|nr:hypothetical protein KC364_g9 [Hortaea werneckii]